MEHSSYMKQNENLTKTLKLKAKNIKTFILKKVTSGQICEYMSRLRSTDRNLETYQIFIPII